MRSTSALSFGANLGFAHMHCDGCGETRLHRYCRCVSCNMTYEEHRAALVIYLKVKVECEDWHAVSDAANDLRELEAAWKAAQTQQSAI